MSLLEKKPRRVWRKSSSSRLAGRVYARREPRVKSRPSTLDSGSADRVPVTTMRGVTAALGGTVEAVGRGVVVVAKDVVAVVAKDVVAVVAKDVVAVVVVVAKDVAAVKVVAAVVADGEEEEDAVVA